jgi:hypothetical protein
MTTEPLKTIKTHKAEIQLPVIHPAQANLGYFLEWFLNSQKVCLHPNSMFF